MTRKQCSAVAESVDLWLQRDDMLAINDEALYRNLAALRTFADCDELIRKLHVSELVHYGEYPSSAVSRRAAR